MVACVQLFAGRKEGASAGPKASSSRSAKRMHCTAKLHSEQGRRVSRTQRYAAKGRELSNRVHAFCRRPHQSSAA